MIAYGWLAHQLADWHPHHAAIGPDGTLLGDDRQEVDEIKTFSGYADSHPLLGNDFLPPMLDSHRVVNHALIELLYDIVVLWRAAEGSYLEDNRVEFFSNEGGASLLTEASRRFGLRHCLIPVEHVEPLARSFGFAIDGMRVLIELMRKVRPNLPDMLANPDVPAVAAGAEHIERSVGHVVEGLLCRTEDDFRQAAEAAGAAGDEDAALEGIEIEARDKATTPGSIFFTYAHKLGMTQAAAQLRALLSRKPRRLWGIIPSPYRWDPAVRLIGELSQSASRRLLRDRAGAGPLEPFLSSLLLDGTSGVSHAAAAFTNHAKPVIYFGSQSDGGGDPHAILEDMLERGRLQVRICPASPWNDPCLRECIFRPNPATDSD